MHRRKQKLAILGVAKVAFCDVSVGSFFLAYVGPVFFHFHTGKFSSTAPTSAPSSGLKAWLGVLNDLLLALHAHPTNCGCSCMWWNKTQKLCCEIQRGRPEVGFGA